MPLIFDIIEMKYGYLIALIFLLLNFGIQAQTILTGTVRDLLNTPVPYASVYLSKTTFGVQTNENGEYSLKGPTNGTYELVASCVGYNSISKMVTLDGTNKRLDFQISARVQVVKEVTIKEKDKNRSQNYYLFKLCFIGKSRNSPFCTIQNPKDIIVYKESEGNNLIAYSVKPLIITNSSFGYKIIYDLKDFRYNLVTADFRYFGNYYFQDITNKKRKNSRANRNRLLAFYGSRLHFMRALFADSLRQENFDICNVELDSCRNGIITNSLKEADLRLSINKDSMILYHFNPVLIRYTTNHPELIVLPNYFRSVTLISELIFEDSLKVYKNGDYTDGYNLNWFGNMANDRIAEMLPYDFVPQKVEK